MSRRVVVTGMGAITPIGLTVEEFWAGVKTGKTGFGPISRFDASEYKCKLAAQVKDFDPKNYMDFKTAKRMEAFCQFAVAATKEAIEDAGLDMEQEDPWRVGVAVGSGIGSLQAMEREHNKLMEKGPNRVNPFLVPMMISNMAAGNVSIQFGLKGKSINVVTACATGTNCIGEAFRTIQYGDAEVMIAGGAESSICPIGVSGFTALTALSPSEDPARCSIPFDKERRRRCRCTGRTGARQKKRGGDLRRGSGLRMLLGCLSYHLTRGRWFRCSQGYGICGEGRGSGS